ncbi:hypothetical protein, partial [Oceaniglobus roseus]|uniref:hypothetical protein n=1 Tax=Oceaniglobus roseus TaxID=1737570 RepID=UPI001C12A6AD
MNRMIDRIEARPDAATALAAVLLVPATTADALPRQAVRLIAALRTLPDVSLTLIAAPPPEAEPVSSGIAALLRLERRLIPLPRRTRLPKLPPLAILPPGSAATAAGELVIDLG